MYQEGLWKAIRFFGGSKTKLAKALGVKKQRLQYWLENVSSIPFEFAVKVEVVTEGYTRVNELIPNSTWIIDYLKNKATDHHYVDVDTIYTKTALSQQTDALEDLEDDINRYGLHRPIAITQDHQLIYGLRRLKAFQRLGKRKIPARIINMESILEFPKSAQLLCAFCTLDEQISIGYFLEQSILSCYQKNNQRMTLLLEAIPNDSQQRNGFFQVDRLVVHIMNFRSPSHYHILKKIVRESRREVLLKLERGGLSLREAIVLINPQETEQEESTLSRRMP